MAKRTKKKSIKERHRLFLNSYDEYAFTKCPKCDAITKIRKFPLAIHIKPNQLFPLNKSCKYCPGCDLNTSETSDRIHIFEDVLNFDIIPGGWYRDGEHPTER